MNLYPRAPKPTPYVAGYGLTRAQRMVLDFIRQRIGEGETPSLREIARHMGWSAVSRAHSVVCELSERGLVSRSENKHRKMVVIEPNTLTIRLPADLYEAVRTLAVMGRCSLEDVVIEATRDGIARYWSQRP